jgi:enterobacterial common antigen flippase
VRKTGGELFRLAGRRRRAATGPRAGQGRSFGSVSATNILLLAAAMLGSIYVARRLGPVGRGEMAVLVVWGSLVAAFSGMGVPNAVTYAVARYPRSRSEVYLLARSRMRRQVLVSSCVWFGIVVTLLWMGRVRVLSALAFLAWPGLTVLLIYPVSVLQGLQRFGYYNLFRVIPAAGPTIVIVFLAVSDRLTVPIVGVLYCGFTGVAAIWGWNLVGHEWRRGHPMGSHDIPVDRSEFSRVARHNIFATAATAFNGRVDQMALSVRSETGVVGLYSVAASTSAVVVPLASAFSAVALSGLAAEADYGARRVMGRNYVLLTGAIACVAASIISLLLPTLVPRVFGADFVESVGPARVLLAGSVFAAVNYTLADVLRGMGTPGSIGIAEGLGACVTAVGVLAVPADGLSSVAAISSLGFGVALLINLGFFVRTHRRAVGDVKQG